MQPELGHSALSTSSQRESGVELQRSPRVGVRARPRMIVHEAVFEKSDDDDGSPNGCTGVHTMEVCRHEGMARAQAIYPYMVI